MILDQAASPSNGLAQQGAGAERAVGRSARRTETKPVLTPGLAIGRFALANGKMFTWRDCKRARLADADRLCGARVLISALVMTSKESPDMTTWPSLAGTAAPPRDPNVDDDEEEEDDDEVDDDREPAVIREPDEGE